MTPKSFCFESFTLDLDRLSLHGPGGQAELRPKSFEVLRYLVEHAGRVVTKDEVVKAVWHDVTVGDGSLTQCIRDVRRAIGDESQRIVKTVPKRGYLMDVAITSGEASQEQERPMIAGADETLPLPDRPSIAVLAFSNFSGDPEQEYFSDGITEDIITELSRFPELLVIARNSTFQYKGKAVDVRRVGRELGVRYVLEGSIRRDGDRVRISAQLIDAVSGAHRWAERYDRKREDVLTIQDELARTIVAILATYVNKAEVERTLSKPPTAWLAHDYYMRAADVLALYSSTLKKDELHEALRLLKCALKIDPKYARAHAALAMYYVSSWFHRLDPEIPSQVVLELAVRSAQQAVRLAPNLSQAHAALGWAMLWNRQHETGIAAFERARVLNPNFTNWRAALTLVYAGEATKAIVSIKEHMRLDPFYEPNAPGTMGFAYYMVGQYGDALPYLREGVARAPNKRSTHQWLAATYAQLHQSDDARAEAAEVLRIDPAYTNQRSPIVATFRRREDFDHFCDGLRKAGLPDR